MSGLNGDDDAPAETRNEASEAALPAIRTPMEDDMESLQELFHETVKDIYYAEKAILKALPKMAKKASSDSLKAAFEEHLEQTQGQVERLDQVFEMLGKRAQGKKCPAIDGIIEEGSEIMKEAKDDTVRDAGMLAAAQSVEHYEISRYGTLVAWANKLGMPEAAGVLQETLDEEKETDAKLSELAESEINVEAEMADDEMEMARANGGAARRGSRSRGVSSSRGASSSSMKRRR